MIVIKIQKLLQPVKALNRYYWINKTRQLPATLTLKWQTAATPSYQKYCMIHLMIVARVFVTFVRFVMLAALKVLSILLLSFCTNVIKLTAAPRPSYKQASSVLLGLLEGTQ